MKMDRKHKPLAIFLYSLKQENGNSLLAIAAWIIERITSSDYKFRTFGMDKIGPRQ